MRKSLKNSLTYLPSISALILLLIFFTGCEVDSISPTSDDGANARGGVIHIVSAGSNDACAAFGLATGCDANWSLIAIQHADGSISGQWQDGFAGGTGGIHVTVDCLIVDGNTAIIGGVVTSGNVNGQDVTGVRAITAVSDNGTSNNDTPDQISFSYFPVDALCDEVPFEQFALLDLTKGQVKVQ